MADKQSRQLSKNRLLNGNEIDGPVMFSKSRNLTVVKAALLAIVTSATYWPSVHGAFIFDDDIYLTNSSVIRAADGLPRIWFTTEPLDYYPISNTSLWVEWRLWGTNPTGYHVTNLLLHVIASLLIWVVLRQLAIPGAFLAALLFAVHPLNVESVAWIAQRKGLLALVFFLLSILWYAREEARRAQQLGATGAVPGFHAGNYYWLSLAAFVLAALCKGSVFFLPLVLLIIVWWQRRRLTRWDLLRSALFWPVAFIVALINVWCQARLTQGSFPKASFAERLSGAGAVVWFYLSKALAPIDLAFIYPAWRIETARWIWWLPLAAAAIFTALLWRHRDNTWSRAMLFAWSFFCAALVPVLGFADFGFMQYTRVADHYEYFSLIGVVAIVAAALTAWHENRWKVARSSAAIATVIIAGLLMYQTFGQCRLYTDPIELYQATLQKNPNCSMLHNNLGILLVDRGQLPDGIRHYEEALKLKEDNDAAHMNLGIALAREGRLQEAIQHYQRAVQINPDLLEAQNNLGNALARIGHPEEALPHLEAAARLKPESATIHNNLGVTLADLGHFPEATDQYQQAIELDANYAWAYFNLAKASAKLSRSSEAVAAAQKALDLAQMARQTELTERIETWLKDYQAQLIPANHPHRSNH